jgi:hypothetical protein
MAYQRSWCRWTSAEDELLRAEWSKGDEKLIRNIRQVLNDRFGSNRTYQSVAGRRRSLGLPGRGQGKYHAWSPQRKRLLLTLDERGLSRKEMALRLGLSRESSVSRRLKELGAPMRYPDGKTSYNAVSKFPSGRLGRTWLEIVGAGSKMKHQWYHSVRCLLCGRAERRSTYWLNHNKYRDRAACRECSLFLGLNPECTPQQFRRCVTKHSAWWPFVRREFHRMLERGKKHEKSGMGPCTLTFTQVPTIPPACPGLSKRGCPYNSRFAPRVLYPSLDRKDGTRNYSRRNVRWLCPRCHWHK